MRNQISTAQAAAILVASATALAAALMPLNTSLAILAWPIAVVLLLPSIWLVDRQHRSADKAREEPEQRKVA